MKKVFKILFFSVIFLFLLSVTAVYVLLTQIDFNKYKGEIVKIVYEQTGRKLTLGDIQVKFSFNPLIEVKDIVFSNAAWARHPVMASARSAKLGFAVLPLLHKNVVIDTFILNDAEVNLEESADGQKNWIFSKEPAKEVKLSGLSVQRFQLIKEANAVENTELGENQAGTKSSDLLSSLVIHNVGLNNVALSYTDGNNKKQNYAVSFLKLNANSEKNMDFQFDVNKGQYTGSGELGGFDKIQSAEGFPVSGAFNILGIEMNADVLLFDIMGGMRFSGTVQAKNFLGAGKGYNESVDLTLNGNLKNIAVNINSLAIAGNVATGQIQADLSVQKPYVRASLRSDKIDISSLMAKKQATLPFSLIKEARATTLVPNVVIPYSVFYSANANVNVEILRLLQGNVSLGENLKFNAKLDNGKASLTVEQGNVAGGNVTADVSADANTKETKVKADIQKLSVPQLLQILNVQNTSLRFLSGGNADVFVDVHGSGETLQAVTESLDGSVVAIVDESQVHFGNIGVMKGNVISQLLDMLKVVKENDDLNLRCAVARADIKNGKATFPNGLAINADKFTIVADGYADLNNDTLGFSIKPFAGKLTDTNIAKALSSLVKLTGTIQNPKIGVDSANAIRTIVGVTTAGPAYLGTQMLLENDGSPCYTALQGTGYENRFPKPDNVVTQTGDDVGQIINDSVGVVKDTTKNIFDMLSGSIQKLNK